MIHAEQVSEEKLNELLGYRFESDWLDFKEQFEPTQKKDKIELCKDIIAMANSENGGYIVLGVRDQDFTPVGLPLDVNIDPATLHDTLDNYIHNKIDLLVASYVRDVGDHKRLFTLIYIAPAPTLILTAKTGAYQDRNKQKKAFEKNQLLVRSGTRSKPADQKDLNALIRKIQTPSGPSKATIEPTQSENNLIHNLPRTNFVNFIGRNSEINEVMATLNHDRAWIVSIDGVGGVGKTALVQKIAWDLVRSAQSTEKNPWEFIIWMSAKKTVLDKDFKVIEKAEPDFKNLDQMLDIILEVTDLATDNELVDKGKKEVVIEILHAFKCLLIVDNLETIDDESVETFVITELKAPSKVFITSRVRTNQMGGTTVRLEGMKMEEAIDFLRDTAKHQNSPIIKAASNHALKPIIDLTGGIPLALKLVVGQTAMGANLDTVIERLTHNRGSSILDFCFEEIYQDLSPAAQKILGVISLFDQPCSLEEIEIVSNFSYQQVKRHIEPLFKFSLVSYDSVNEIDKYSLLPLTRIFSQAQAENNFPNFYITARKNLSIYLLRKEELLHQEGISEASIQEAGAKSELERLAVGLTDVAKIKYETGNYKQAIKFLREAEKLAPRLWYVQQRWANIEEKQGHIAAARKHYDKAIECDRMNAKLHSQAANFESAHSGKQDKIIKLYQRAIDLEREQKVEPKNIFAMRGLANQFLKKAKELKKYSKDNANINAILGKALDVINNAFEEGVVESKENLNFWLVKGQILQQLRSLRHALEICENALKIGYNPDIASLAENLRTELERHNITT